jgi:RNA polymerase sigma-70 factor (ECF subfamily)
VRTTLPADDRLIEALRDGDEASFELLVEQYHGPMVRMARMYVPSREVAEDVVQQTWLGVLRGIDRFEGRSSFRTWLFGILLNQARTAGQRERRSIPFSSAWAPAEAAAEPSVDPERFLPPDDPEWPRHWTSLPQRWDGIPEDRLLSSETRRVIEEAMAMLPPAQRELITLRDVLGWSSAEACNALGVSETNQRVLLHRARARVRRALERYLDEEDLSA